ncbi:14633_t:CDS:2 [Entrophospora sp. SA101]|nr:14633_t:CDS:2 [Entrophospora sp. SA101]
MNLKNLLDEKLKPGFALKIKSKKYSPEDMLKELQRLVKTDELEAENIPSLQQIKSWISRFSQHHKKQASSN